MLDAVFTIQPSPRSIIAGRNARSPRTTPSTFTSIG